MSTSAGLTRRRRITVVLVGCSLLLAGCASRAAAGSSAEIGLVPATGGQATVALASPFSSCWPEGGAGVSPADQLVYDAVLPSAFSIGPKGAPVIDAEVFSQIEVVSDSPLTIDYSFNAAARWSTGRPIGPADLIAAWRAGLKANTPTRPGYQAISSIVASGGGEVATVVFKQDFADWRALFSHFLPAGVVPTKATRGCTRPEAAVDVSAGPFLIERSDPTMVTLEKNPHWWGTPAALDVVKVRIAPTAATAISWVEHNEAQVAAVWPFTTAELLSVQQDERLTSEVSQTSTMTHVVLSLTRGPTANPVVRDAMAAAIDPKSVGLALYGYATANFGALSSPLTTPLRTTLAGGDRNAGAFNLPTPSTGPGAPGVAVLSEVGYRLVKGHWVDPHGARLEISIAFDRTGPWQLPLAEGVARQLGAQGIGYRLVAVVSHDAASRAVATHAVDAALLVRVAPVFLSQTRPWFSTEVLGAKALDNPTRYQNLSVDADYDTGSLTLNPAEAASAYAAAAAQLEQDRPVIPLVSSAGLWLWRKRLVGVVPNAWLPTGLSALAQWSIEVPAPLGSNTPVVLGAGATAR